MNIRPILIGAVAYTVVTFPLAVVWHIALFESTYRGFGYFGEKPSFILGFSVYPDPRCRSVRRVWLGPSFRKPADSRPQIRTLHGSLLLDLSCRRVCCEESIEKSSALLYDRVHVFGSAIWDFWCDHRQCLRQNHENFGERLTIRSSRRGPASLAAELQRYVFQE